MRHGERSVRLVTLLVLASLALTLLPAPVEAARVTTAQPLPFPLLGTSSVWTGTAAYVFGGRSNSSYQATVLKYDPGSGAITTLPATLPTGRQSTSAVWTGEVAYIFGGAELIQYNDPQFGQIVVPNAVKDILRFDPRTGTVTKMTDALPEGVWGTSAVWDASENAAYVFGGFAFDYSTKKFERKDWIVKYKPNADGVTDARVVDLSATAAAARLPYPTQDAAVAVVGTKAYLFGGLTTEPGGDGAPTAMISDRVVTFALNTEQVATLSSRLPYGIQFAPAVAVDGDIYVFGGRLRNASASGTIVKYSVSQNHAFAFPLPLPSVRYAMSAVTDGANVWLVGGRDGNQNVGGLRDVVSFYPGVTEPTAPRALTGRCQESGILLSWSAPTYDGGAAVTGYRVYRIDGDGVPIPIGETADPSYLDPTAKPGTRYTFRVAALNSAGASRAMAELELTSCLRPPTEPIAFEAYAGDATAYLRWQPPTDLGGATNVNYRIYLNDSLVPLATIAATKYTAANLKNEVSYRFHVTALAGTFESPASPKISVKPSDKIPAAPTGVAIGLVSTQDRFDVTWSASARATSYVVRYGTDLANMTKSVTSTTTSATITGIEKGRPYYIDVLGVDGALRSPPSDLQRVAYVVAPGAVWNAVAMPGAGYIRIQWSPPNSTGGADAVYYKIFRNTTGNPLEETRVGDAVRWTGTAYVDRNTTAGETYTYRIVPFVVPSGLLLYGKGAQTPPAKAPTAVNQLPVANVIGAPSPVDPRIFEFDASFSTDADGRIVRYVWDFGDGSALKETTNPDVAYRYLANGVFTVRLTVQDDRGDKSARPGTFQVCLPGPCQDKGGTDPGTTNTTPKDTTPPAAPPRASSASGFLGLPGFEPLVALAALAAVALGLRRKLK